MVLRLLSVGHKKPCFPKISPSTENRVLRKLKRRALFVFNSISQRVVSPQEGEDN